jgi:hypothetical protein
MSRGRVRDAFVRVAPAVAIGIAGEASANPPPPNELPDPPLTAPTKDEAPTVVRKHATHCWAFYPSGGSLAIECPPELATEPLGEALMKNASGRCQFVPLRSGYPGRTGYLDPCPKLFSVVARAGTIPPSSRALVAEKSGEDPEPWIEPPRPARLESSPPQQVGCALGRGGNAKAMGFAAGLALCSILRVRRAGRASSRPRIRD